MDLNFQYPNQPEPVQEENQGSSTQIHKLVTDFCHQNPKLPRKSILSIAVETNTFMI